MLEQLILLITYIITQIIILKIYSNLSKKEIKIRKLTCLIIITSLIETIIEKEIPSALNGLICIIYFIIIIKTKLKIEIKQMLYYTLVIWLIGSIIDVTIMYSYNSLVKIIPIISEYRVIYKSICSIILVLVLVILTKNKKVKEIIEKGYNKVKEEGKTYLKIIAIILLYYMFDAVSVSNLKSKETILIIILTIIIMTSNLIWYLIKEYEIYNTKKTNQYLIENNRYNQKRLEKEEIKNHNLKNKLIGIKSISNEKTREMINELIKEISKTKEEEQIKNIPIGLDGLIYEHIKRSPKEVKIMIDNKINSEIYKVIRTSQYNILCESLGICIDNAMEASKESKEKIVYINFKEKKKEIKVEIINTFKGEIDIELLGTKNYTSKISGHGLGLYSLFHKDKLKIKTRIKNNLFINELIIEK